MAQRGTTLKTGNRFRTISTKINRSKKVSKSPSLGFGTSSQFRGIGRGQAGDPRK